MRYSILFIVLFGAVSGFSQDQLFKKDNSKTEVKVLEVTPTEIKYKLFTYQDGPTITVLKSEVALIIYQNGMHETFNTPPVAQQSQPVIVYTRDLPRMRDDTRRYNDSMNLVKYREITSTKNVVSLNLMEPLNGSLGISYMREFADGQFHAYVPVSVGISEPFFNQIRNGIFGSPYYYNNVTNYQFKRKTFEAGVGFHIHTSGKRVVTHFIGPYFGVSQFTGRYDTYGYDPMMGSTQVYGSHNFVMNRYTFMLDNGILFRMHKNFTMMLLAGLGYHTDDYLANNPKNYNYNGYNYSYNDFPINSFKLGLSLGYRF